MSTQVTFIKVKNMVKVEKNLNVVMHMPENGKMAEVQVKEAINSPMEDVTRVRFGIVSHMVSVN